MVDNIPDVHGGAGLLIEATPVVPFDNNGVYAPQIPYNLLTGVGAGDGASRIRVDVGQSGFFAKREYRIFQELNIPAGEKQLFRFVSTADFIVQEINLTLDNGSARLATYSGGTPTGTFTAMTAIPANSMSEGPVAPAQAVTVSRTASGASNAITGGTQLDVMRLLVSGATGQAQTVGVNVDSYRGAPAGTYYAMIENLDGGAISGVFRLRWEQR